MKEGLCDAEQRAKCEDEGYQNLKWVCSQCPKKRPQDLHAYTHKLLDLHALQRGGYPFEKDDLTYEEWIDLGRVAAILQAPRLF